MEVTARPGLRPALLGLVFAGGTVGTAVRWGLETGFAAPAGSWPWTTLWINLSGSLLLGGLLEALAATGPDSGWRRRVRLGVGTGLLGGYTTYSTFSIETVRLVREGTLWLGLAYAVVSVVAGIGLALAGNRLVRLLLRRRPQATAGRPEGRTA
ncbi:MAG: CrcB family protein [Propionicimonas sp.]|nr:CrcB family protein [Propionicimonas sp.]